ncbi:MAG: SRPBCC family protein [Methylovirgula sp.]
MQALQYVGLRKSGLIQIGLSLCMILGLANSSVVSAHGAAPKKIEEKIDIAAKPEVVWGLISDFANISHWNPAVTSSKAVVDPEQGRERILTLKNGSKIIDAQTDYDAKKMTYSYRRVDDDVKAFPVSFYSATITVTPTATGSDVDWIGRFYRGDTSNEPPPGLGDQDATDAMTSLFQAGLKNLKTLAEKK